MLFTCSLTYIFIYIPKKLNYDYLFRLRKVSKTYKYIMDNIYFCHIFLYDIGTNFKIVRKTFTKSRIVNIFINENI